MLGRNIAHYRILRLIGEGGMGQVFLADDTKLDREVALKILPEEQSTPDRIVRFEREAKAVASLNHPNILAIHDFGKDGPVSYVVMEYLEGHTLGELLASGPLSRLKALAYSLEIVQGLGAAHDKGIVHRDVKPANLFVTREGRIKILDFGLASVRTPHESGSRSSKQQNSSAPTKPGTALGTAAYMSPEQVRGEKVDPRSDIFAFGSVLYEMLTGKPAFHEETAVETMHAILKTDPPAEPLQELGVPEALTRVIYRCLEKNVDERFQSAADLGFVLKTMAASEPSGERTSAGVVSDSTPDASPEPPGPRSIAVLPFANLSADIDSEYFSDGMTDEIINALTQLKGFRVVARTSSFAFKGKLVDISEVAEKLNVDTVVEGSVRRAGSRVRITVQLINVEDGYHLWSERYDREMDDVFEIQDDIATCIAKKLELTWSKSSDGQLVKPYTDDIGAYDLYLKGRYFVEQRTEGIQRGLEFFNRALREDPEYVPAYVGIAEALSLLVVYGVGNPLEMMPKAKAAAMRALELDDRSGEAHNAAAMVYYLHDWDWSRAREAFQRAQELNPGHVASLYWKGLLYHLFIRKEFELALADTRRALELDPMASIARYAHGLVFMGAERYDEAIDVMSDALEQDPTSPLFYRVIGASRFGNQQYDEAIAAFEKGVTLSMRHCMYLADLGAAYVAAGRDSDADLLQAEIAARAKTSYVAPVALAAIPLAKGRNEEAVSRFEEAYHKKDPGLIVTNSWPTLAAARKIEPVRELLGRMGLELESEEPPR